jgi:NAD(P)-dependent dehydrogenase (short-subunit alcohol dehydrogenase family)
MTDNKTWFITGAWRGVGADIRADVAAGNDAVATARNADAFCGRSRSPVRADPAAGVA